MGKPLFYKVENYAFIFKISESEIQILNILFEILTRLSANKSFSPLCLNKLPE